MIEPAAARRLLLHGLGLLDDAARRATPAVVRRAVERMGFVQLDSINVVARAHHLTLAARLDGYRPAHLATLIEKRRALFEHWTHDASAILTTWFVPWRHRCRRMVDDPRVMAWLAHRMGRRWRRTVLDVLGRIRTEGPLRSRDFEHTQGRAPKSSWWGWKPSKAALEYLWWRGDLSIVARENFHKVYDLTERHFPEMHDHRPPPEAEYLAWACQEALDRLVVATPRELAAFHGAITLAEARDWCRRGSRSGDLQPVLRGEVEGPARPAFALASWRRRLAHAERALARREDRMVCLSPFDPVVRDRQRLQRLFGFTYRFEAFVPAAKRRFGYYVLPVLAGDRFVARCDLKSHRDRRELEVRGLWWEEGQGRAKGDRRRLAKALQRVAALTGAQSVRLPPAGPAPALPGVNPTGPGARGAAG